MREADHLIDVGPGARCAGEKIVAAGTPKQVARNKSITGQYLSGKRKIPVPTERRSGMVVLKLLEQVRTNLQTSQRAFWKVSQSLEFRLWKIDLDQWHLEKAIAQSSTAIRKKPRIQDDSGG